MVLTLRVVTEERTVAETEGLTSLLTDEHTGNGLCSAVALAKLLRVGVRLDGATELLGGRQRKVLDVVRVDRRSLCARRCLGDGRKTIPRVASGVRAGGRDVQDAVIDTGLVKPVAGLVPGKSGSHDTSFLRSIGRKRRGLGCPPRNA